MRINSNLISCEEAAKILGIDVITLHFALQEGRYEFGTAVKCTKSWRYIIVRSRFEAYMNADDMKPQEKAS